MLEEREICIGDFVISLVLMKMAALDREFIGQIVTDVKIN